MAASRNAFAIAAAHGITPQTAITWKPDLPRTPRVMVPIQLDALVLRADGGTWADTQMSAPPAGGGPVSRLSLLPDPFKELPGPRKRGVYLHWALPDGLTRGTSPDPHTQATFPAIPDRWLVVRMFPDQGGQPRRGVKAWVLPASDKKPVPVDLDKWIDPGPPKLDHGPLTAAAGGDPAWAAYYDNVVNRLSFYDDLSDIHAGPVAYLVCGWYSDPAQDPLGTNIHSLTAFDQKLAELGWELAAGELEESHSRFAGYVQASSSVGLAARETFLPRQDTLSRIPLPAGALSPKVEGSSPAALDKSGHPEGGSYQTNGAWWPSQIICHGSAVAIGWPGIGFPGAGNGLLSGEVGGPPSASSINVAFGNTLTEAMSELVARANGKAPEARVLEAFMLGALQELDQADGLARIDARVHATMFGSLPGGEVEETITVPGSTAGPRLPSKPVVPKPGIFKQAAAGKAFAHDLPFTQSNIVQTADRFASAELRSESTVFKSRLRETIPEVSPVAAALETGPKQITVKRSLPRRYYPSDPVLLLQGADRSFKHGADGLPSEDGRLMCRLTGFALTELACSSIDGSPLFRPSITGDDVLMRGIENGSVPPECEDLLRETVLHDPGTAVHAAAAAGLQGAAFNAQAQNFMVEQTAWWATRDPRFDYAPLVAKSGFVGTLPAGIAVTPPVRPWTPLHLDWKIQFIPSPHGADDWTLDEIDFHPSADSLPKAGDTTSGLILTGRALLTGGIAENIASSVRRALAQAASTAGSEPLKPRETIKAHSAFGAALLESYAALQIAAAAPAPGGAGVPAIDRSALDDIAGALEKMDVLGGALDSFHARLHDAGIQLRSGVLRILRLRLVDCFGQFVDLAGSSNATIIDPKRLVETAAVQIPSRPDIMGLPPRFVSTSRLWFRFMDAAKGNDEAKPDLSPVCGYLLPNHLDGDLEFFGQDGINLGVVRPEPGAGVIWEDAPGLPSTVGADPARAIPNASLAGVAQGLLDWGIADATTAREDALSALLRILDSTLWAVDPFGHTGDEHLSLLIGHPVAVLRARLKLEVEEDLHPDLLNLLRLPVRLGALTHWQDGLLGYFVNDDYRTLYCADAAIAGFARDVGPNRGFLQPINLVDNYYQNFSNDIGAGVTEGKTPVDHPYVDSSGVFHIQPNQEVNLTLLLEPHSVVHATTGYLPRKEIGMRREWVADALAKLAPTFRFGPVLVDPKRIRMPVANDLHGSWSWDHRIDITTWAEDKVITSAGAATMSDDPAKGQEGWLRLTPLPEEKQ